MTLELLTSFIGWMTVLNVVILAFAAIVLLVFKHGVIGIHQRVTGLAAEDLSTLYVTWLGNYKLLIIFFGLVPYLALCLI